MILPYEKAVVCIIGGTGSGKTTLVELLKEKVPYFTPLVYYTTRPIRDGEKDGITYHFRTIDEYERDKKDGLLLEYRDYKVINNQIWSYYTKRDQFEDGHVYITAPSVDQAQSYIKDENLFVVKVFLDVSIEERRKRILERKGVADLDQERERRLVEELDELNRFEIYDCQDNVSSIFVGRAIAESFTPHQLADILIQKLFMPSVEFWYDNHIDKTGIVLNQIISSYHH